MVDNDVLGIIEVVDKGSQLWPSEFIGAVYCFIFSIYPVDAVLKQSPQQLACTSNIDTNQVLICFTHHLMGWGYGMIPQDTEYEG